MILFALDQILDVRPGLAVGPGKGHLEIGHPRRLEPLSSSAYRKSFSALRQPKNKIDSPIGAPFSFSVGPLLQEPAEGCHAGARPDHDHRQCGLAGGWNGMVGLRTKVNYGAALHAGLQMAGGHPVRRCP